MMVGILILTALFLFLSGVVMGFLCAPKKKEKPQKTPAKKIPDPVTEELKVLYENFLSYDGTDQS